MAHFKATRRVNLTVALPESSRGKLLKRGLRRRYA